MTAPHLRLVGEPPVSDARLPPSFFLVVADHDRGFFSIEGPMTDDQPWKDAVLRARGDERRVELGPAGPDRDALAADYRRDHKLGGVPPGSIVKPRL